MVKVSFLKAGYCTHPGKIAHSSQSFRALAFPASVAVIEHSKEGIILFDTGYSDKFFKATKSFPESIYRWITPVYLNQGESALEQLKNAGISVNDVRHVVLSHFHADHIGGVSDFTKSKFIYQQESYESIRNLGRISSLRKAFLPSLIPVDFLDRSLPVPQNSFQKIDELDIFDGGYDLFGDGSIWLVQLPGHAEGHTGLWVRTQEKDYLLAGDACYVKENIIEDHPSSFITRLIFDDFSQYKLTLNQIHRFHKKFPKTQIVPCHCQSTISHLPVFSGSNVGTI